MLPNWGHEGADLTSHWLVAAGLARRTDPELAKTLAWSWDQLGRPMQSHHDAGFSERAVIHSDLLRELPKGYTPRQLQSTWWPGFGAVLRAHPGDPHETYLSYRQGYMTSHCDANQSDFVLYAKGAPLTTLSLFGYAIHNTSPFAKLNTEFGWHNRVRFGAMTDTGGWPGGGAISGVHAHSFSDSADYLLGLGDYGPQRWARQIVFLKGRTAAGPNYFVLRDSFHNPDGEPPRLQRKWWYLKTPGKKEQVQAGPDQLNYTSAFGPRLHARFLQPAAIQTQSRDATQSGPLYNQMAVNWQKAARPDAKEPPATSVKVEETITVTAVGPIAPGEDVLVVLYPQRRDEPPPRCESLGRGVARITTAESTDYVFADRQPVRFQQGGVTLEGLAGAVRVFPQEVHLIVAEWPSAVAYQGVRLESDVPVLRVIPRGQTGQPQTIRQGYPGSNIAFWLDPGAGPIDELSPVVKKQRRTDGVAYLFDSPETFRFVQEGVEFVGRRGGIVVDERAHTTRLVLLDGWQIASGSASARQWTLGPIDVTFHADRIAGRTAGLGRLVHLSRPAGLDRLPVLEIDKQTFAPGTHDQTLIVPAMPGEHTLEIRCLKQPPIFRTWQLW